MDIIVSFINIIVNVICNIVNVTNVIVIVINNVDNAISIVVRLIYSINCYISPSDRNSFLSSNAPGRIMGIRRQTGTLVYELYGLKKRE